MKRGEYNFRMLALRRLRDSGSRLNPDDPVLAVSLNVARALLRKYPTRTGTDRIGRDCELARWAISEVAVAQRMNAPQAAPISPVPEDHNFKASEVRSPTPPKPEPPTKAKSDIEVTPEQARENYAKSEEAFYATEQYFREFGKLPADDFDLKAYYRAARSVECK